MSTSSKAAHCVAAQAKENSGLLYRTLLEHPHNIGETYGQHLGFTVRVAAYLLVTAAIIVIHGLVPAFFDHTGSARIARLHARFAGRGPTTAR